MRSSNPLNERPPRPTPHSTRWSLLDMPARSVNDRLDRIGSGRIGLGLIGLGLIRSGLVGQTLMGDHDNSNRSAPGFLPHLCALRQKTGVASDCATSRT